MYSLQPNNILPMHLLWHLGPAADDFINVVCGITEIRERLSYIFDQMQTANDDRYTDVPTSSVSVRLSVHPLPHLSCL